MPIVPGMCIDFDRAVQCSKVDDNGECISYMNPAIWKRYGGCFLSSIKQTTAAEKKKINPLKASRRAKKGTL